MKIALLCGHFLPQLGYVEVHLAKAFHRLGHRVVVLTTDVVPPYVQNLAVDKDERLEGVEVIRLHPTFSLGQIVVAKGVHRTLKKIRPDFVVAIGLGKRFVLPAFGAEYPVVALYGDNTHSHRRENFADRLKTKVLYEVFKRQVYRRAVQTADLHVAYTPESFEVAGRALGGKYGRALAGENKFIHLGFWPEEFHFDESLRADKRTELGFLPSDVVLITAGRISPEKNLPNMAPVLRALPRHFKWLVVGAVDDQATSDLRQTLQDTVEPDRFMLLPRASREALNAFYCAADLGVYTVPAISIMEAAGTGLPMIFPQTESLKALGELGFHPGTWGGAADVNADAIRKADPESDARMARAERANCHLSWPVQAERLIAWMEEVRTDRNSGKVPSNN